MFYKIKKFIITSILLGTLIPSIEISRAEDVSYNVSEKNINIDEMATIGPIYQLKSIVDPYEMTEEDLKEELRYDEMGLIAQLVEAEAGNQDLIGKRLVVDVVLNRVDSDQFPNTVEEVVYEYNQFEVIDNGLFDKVAWYISDSSFKAVEMEYENRSDQNVLFFSTKKSKYAKNHFKHGDHWFGW